jgi:hypothetical protein
MKTQRLLIALTVINLMIMTFLLFRETSPAQANDDMPKVLRGTALEIVDDQGRVRASIKLHPEEVFKQTGRKYPETVMFRLIDQHGRPEVKIGASVEGGGLSFIGDSDVTQVHLQADGSDAILRLSNEDGKQQVVKP